MCQRDAPTYGSGYAAGYPGNDLDIASEFAQKFNCFGAIAENEGVARFEPADAQPLGCLLCAESGKLFLPLWVVEAFESCADFFTVMLGKFQYFLRNNLIV